MIDDTRSDEGSRPLLGTASAHLTNDIPRGPDDLVGQVREAMVGCSYTSAADLAVCEGDALVGLVTIEMLLGAEAGARRSVR